MLAETYNALIKGFGKRFEDFTVKELTGFAVSLSKVGLRQQDIIASCIEQIEVKANAPKDNEKNLGSFHSVIFPLFRAIVDLNMHSEIPEFNKLIDDEWVKKVTYGGKGFAESALHTNSD